MINISIFVKKHIKKYLAHRYGKNCVLSKKSLLGILIFELLDKKITKQDRNFINFSEKYTITISEAYFYKRGFYISSHKKKFISIALEKLFIEDLYAFIDITIENNTISAVKAMKIFLCKYDITENEVKFESLYRSYQRYSGESIKKKKLQLI